jgi:hypothetical protein
MGLQAKAGNVVLNENDKGLSSSHSGPIGANVTAAEVGFQLDIADQFIFKLFNDKLSVSANTPGAPSSGAEKMIYLGEISAGISTAADCTGLTGLVQVAALGVSAQTDADTGVAVSARTAECNLDIASMNRKIQMRIPLQEVALKAGAKALMADYSIVNILGKEFDSLVICGGQSSGSQATPCNGASAIASGHTVLATGSPSGQNPLTVEVVASLQGSLAKTSYEGYVVAVVGLQ